MNKKIVENLKKEVKFAKIKDGLISIIFPIYGSFDVERLLIAIQSVKNQKDVEVEIIVLEEGERPKLKDKLDNSIKYRFKKHIPQKDLSDFNPGKIRNDAIRISCGEYVYTNDADIVFMNPLFLSKCKKIIESDKNLVLFRPQMRRLPIENFEEFKKRARKFGISKAIGSLDKSQEFLATTDKIKRELKVVTKSTDEYLRVFITSSRNFLSYKSNQTLRGKEPIIWSENLHCGGNFFRRKQFDLVGGYCEDFINWGCEDLDLQWKFKEFFNLQFFPQIEEFTVLHLDHERGYFSPEMWKRNNEICNLRKNKSIMGAIKKDIKKWKIIG